MDQAVAEARHASTAELAAALPPAGFPCAREVVIDPDRSAPDALIAAAKRLGCDLIALGARGRGGLKSLVLGSVAEAALARSRIDVVVAPAPRA